jgi:hypothetical protein
MGMQVEERIARIGSNDPESHLGIPYSHVSARITIKYRVDSYPLSHFFSCCKIPFHPFLKLTMHLNGTRLLIKDFPPYKLFILGYGKP